jgi:hypothetical protein
VHAAVNQSPAGLDHGAWRNDRPLDIRGMRVLSAAGILR